MPSKQENCPSHIIQPSPHQYPGRRAGSSSQPLTLPITTDGGAFVERGSALARDLRNSIFPGSGASGAVPTVMSHTDQTCPTDGGF